jgi:four helix bundle protein
MSTPKSISDSMILQKANDLVNNVHRFTEDLPNDYLFDIKFRLKSAIANLPVQIADGFKVQSRIEHVRAKIRANSYLEECRDYLEIVEKFRLGNAAELKSEIEEVSNMLINEKVH